MLIRTALLASAFCVTAAASGLAQSPPPAPPPAPQTAPKPSYPKECEWLSREPWRTRNKFYSQEPVFGKHSMFWTDADFDAAIAFARQCHGAPSKIGLYVNSDDWISMFQEVQGTIKPLILKEFEVQQFAKQLGGDRIIYPHCWKILEWKSDDFSMQDSSASLFGTSFMQMSDDDLHRAIQFTNQCLIYLPVYYRVFTIDSSNFAIEIANKVMDKALLILKRREDYRNLWKARPTDILVELDGATILPTFTTPETREMIVYFNKFAESGRRFTPETITTLLKMADAIIAKPPSGWDKAYADAVRQRAQNEMFRLP